MPFRPYEAISQLPLYSETSVVVDGLLTGQGLELRP